jgi:tRNA dimethylallyltransferase
VRLIRALEIIEKVGRVPAIKKAPMYDTLILGIKVSDENLKKNIKKRLLVRIKKGMIAEGKKLHKNGLSYKRMRELGLEYKYLADFLEKKIKKEEMIRGLENAIWQYAKRQKTWFKKDTRTIWIDTKNLKTLNTMIKDFLEK